MTNEEKFEFLENIRLENDFYPIDEGDCREKNAALIENMETIFDLKDSSDYTCFFALAELMADEDKIDAIKKYLSGFVPVVALPRCIRIVNQIPTNAQGKFVKNEISAMLDSSVAEPILQNIVKTDTNVVADLTFLGDSAYFMGHFPNFPILPGVVQMHFVFRFIKQFFHVSASAFDVIKLKYSSLILPDITTHFELTRVHEHEFAFCYSQHGKPCSAGKIVIKGATNV